MNHKIKPIRCRQLSVATSTTGHVAICADCGQMHLGLFRELAEMPHVAQLRPGNNPTLQGTDHV